MPVYSYQCDCGVRFDGSDSMANHSKPHKCPDCGSLANRNVPNDLNGVFNISTNGVGPQNTGVSDLDVNLDRVVGADAKKGWDAIESRNKSKTKTLRDNPGATAYDLSRNPDDTYRVMSPEERGMHARAFTINHTAMKKLKDATTR